MMYRVVRVAALTAIDEDGRVVKDERRNLVVDPRDRRVVAYRQRWYISDGGKETARNASFPSRLRDEADALRVQLLGWLRDGTSVDSSGRSTTAGEHDDAVQPATSSVETIAEGIDRYLATHSFGPSNGYMYETNLRFLRDCLPDQPGGDVSYRPRLKRRSRRDPEPERRALRWSELTMEMLEDVLLVRRKTNINKWKSYLWQLDRHLLWLEYDECPPDDRKAGHPPAFVERPSIPAPAVYSASAEAKFSIVANRFFAWAVMHGYVDRNPWDAAKDAARKPKHSRITKRMVPDIDEMFAIADHMQQRPGGADYATTMRLWAVSGFRPEEWWALRAEDFEEDAGGPHMMVRHAEVVVAASRNVSQPGSPIQTKSLKHRDEGDERRVPIPIPAVAAEVRALAARRQDPTAHLMPEDLCSPTGRRRWVTEWFNPARNAVLPERLQGITPRWMRHAAITWWLESGMPVHQAAERAGNSPGTLLLHYASATTEQARFTDDLLRSNGPQRRLRIVGGHT